MKKLKYIYILLFLLFIPSFATAANHYVREGSTGNGDGSNWTNAFTSLPSALIRGDTYYIADGSYGNYTFNDAESGPTYIYIKKATGDDHGTETGWLTSYGDGVVNIDAPLSFTTDYWDIDGQFGSLDSDLGIRVWRSGSDGKCVTISDGADYINLTYVELENSGYSSSSYKNADCLYVYASTSGSSNCTFTSCWLHNANRTAVWVFNISDYTFDNCWFTEIICMDIYAVHGEAFSINQTPNTGINTIKNSLFRNIEGSVWIGFMNSFGDRSNYNWDIFNNLFYVDGNHVLDGYISDGYPPSESDFTGSNSVIDILSRATASNINFYGNTFANMQQNGMITLGSDCTNCIVRNNLFVHTSRTGTFAGTTTSNNQSTTNTGMVNNYSTFDLTLSQATNEGYTLSSPYNVDRVDADRGGRGWDIGAYEYSSGSTPNNPDNLTITQP